MRTLNFKNKDEMPVLGLGTWKSQPGEVYDAVITAIKEGYRHIDCAPIYGNEKEIGEAITHCIKNGIVKRSDLWITSKLWNTAHAKDEVIPALEQTLNHLQTDYLDLYLIHWPVALKKEVSFPKSGSDFISLEEIPISLTWEAMEQSVSLSLTRHIGVSNFGIKALGRLISISKLKPEVNQVECHPYLQQNDLIAFCEYHDIIITAYSPLGSFDRLDVLKAANEPKLLDDPMIVEISKTLKCTSAQILISWAIQRGISVIPKSVNANRIFQNFKAEQIQLSDIQMQTISKLDRNFRYVTGQFWVFDGGPYTLEDLWA